MLLPARVVVAAAVVNVVAVVALAVAVAAGCINIPGIARTRGVCGP